MSFDFNKVTIVHQTNTLTGKAEGSSGSQEKMKMKSEDVV